MIYVLASIYHASAITQLHTRTVHKYLSHVCKHYLVYIPHVIHNQPVSFLHNAQEHTSEIVNLTMRYNIAGQQTNFSNYGSRSRLLELRQLYYVFIIHILELLIRLSLVYCLLYSLLASILKKASKSNFSKLLLF